MKISHKHGTWGHTIGHLSYWDIALLLVGREIYVGASIIRVEMAYEAFNADAPAVEASRSALIPFNRKARRARRWSRFFGA